MDLKGKVLVRLPSSRPESAIGTRDVLWLTGFSQDWNWRPDAGYVNPLGNLKKKFRF